MLTDEVPMPDFPIKILSPDEIESLEREIIEEAQAGSKEVAWHKVQPLRKAQHHQREAAISLLRILDHQCLPIEGAVDVLLEIARAHDQDVVFWRRSAELSMSSATSMISMHHRRQPIRYSILLLKGSPRLQRNTLASPKRNLYCTGWAHQRGCWRVKAMKLPR